MNTRILHFGRTVLVSMVAAMAIASAPANAQENGITDDEIRIGGFAVLTGNNFSFGRMPMNGVEAVFDKVNAEGGIHGRKLLLIRQDTQCDPATAITVVRKLIHNENVFSLIGGACSNAVMAARPDIVESGIPYLNFAAASNAISAPPVKNIYTTNLTSPLESRLQLQFAIERGAKRIAIVAQHDAWGRDRYEPLMGALKEAGIEPVADEEVNINLNDATAQVLKVQQANPDAVILLAYPKPAAVFMRDAARLGFKPPLIIGQSAIPDPVAFAEQIGVEGAATNFYTISPVRYGPDDPEVADWKSRLETLFPSDQLNAINLFGVGAGQVMVEALKRAGRDLTRDKFLAELGSLEGLEVDVYPAKITCKAGVSHQCLQGAAWLGLEGGTAKVMSVSTLN